MATAKRTARKPKPATSPFKSAPDASPIKTLKTASCPNLSGQSGLSYETGKDSQGQHHIRITGNQRGGFFSAQWIAWEDVYTACLSASPMTMTSITLRSLYAGKSSNSAGFLLAALTAEELVRRQPKYLRHYELTRAGHKLAGKGSGKTASVDKPSSSPS